MRRLMCWVVVAGLLGAVGRLGADDSNQFPREFLEQIQKQERQNQLRELALAQKLQQVKPVEMVRADSLSLHGDGLGGLPRNRDWQPHPWTMQLENGRLSVTIVSDFEVQSFRFHLDTDHDFAKQMKIHKAEHEQLAPWLPKLPAEVRKQSEAWHAELQQVRNVVDLSLVALLAHYRTRLTGPLALQPAQLERLRAAATRSQALAEELGRIAVDKAPEAATLQKIPQLLAEQRKCFDFSWHNGDLFTPEQRRALGFDPDPNGPQPPRRSVAAAVSSGSASAGGSTADDAKVAAQLAEQEKQRARLEAEVKAQRAAAKVKFKLKGQDARNWSADIPTPAGLLRVWIDDADPNGAAFTFFLDAQKTWATEKARRLREYEVYMAELKGQEAKDAKKEHERMKKELDDAPNQYVADWSWGLGQLRAKTGSVPNDVQQRFDRMAAAMAESAAALVTAYQAVLDKPGDEPRERALFAALRTYVKTEARNKVLHQRDEYDPDGTRGDLPWLLSMDQVDLINQGQLTTSSSVSSGSNGTLSIRARPVGEKQYVAISAENATLGDLTETVQRTARKFYRNHRLQLKFAPEAADKPVRGLVEGKSAEELFQSLALRAGVALEKDKQTPHGWLLKP